MVDWSELVNDHNCVNCREGSVGWVITVVVDELFDVFHDFTVAAAGLNGHVRERGIAGYGSGLGVENEGNCEKAFDEFDKGITTVGLEDRQTDRQTDRSAGSVRYEMDMDFTGNCTLRAYSTRYLEGRWSAQLCWENAKDTNTQKPVTWWSS